MAREWVRVRDPLTGHEFDVREDAVREGAHEIVADYPTSPAPRPAKPKVNLPAAAVQQNIDAVLAEVGDDPAKAAAALELEQASTRPRSTLIEALCQLADPSPADGGEQNTDTP